MYFCSLLKWLILLWSVALTHDLKFVGVIM
jgi:hypothetical protein